MSHSHSSSSSTMDMSMPMMVFTTATNTPLYSLAWTPKTTGQYAGTCIFLILLAIILRSLYAFRATLEQRWLDKARNRRYVVVAGRGTEAGKIETDEDAKTGSLVTANGVEEKVKVVKRGQRGVLAWRFGTDVGRGALVMIITGVAYLLMLAVMTMNVGYFLSVLAGTFLGEVAVGRYAQGEEH